ncbi:MAG: hypothetical protein FP813_08270 [Desulfurivibrio sp.]|nr:hypothetical protein [Desulfurivibrio sp.]MBU4119154.1 hypothetical protein [Pseudomonadota bacterium]
MAKAMQERFGDKLSLEIHTVNSPEAAAYTLKGATNVFVNQEWVALDVATSTEKMEAYLNTILAAAG